MTDHEVPAMSTVILWVDIPAAEVLTTAPLLTRAGRLVCRNCWTGGGLLDDKEGQSDDHHHPA